MTSIPAEPKESKLVRAARAYVRLLLVLEMLLFVSSLVLHLSVFFLGANEAYAQYALPLFRGSVIAMFPVITFVKDGMWKNQIMSCPKWMWKGALAIGMYALLTVGLQVISPQGKGSFSEQAMTVSGFPLGFDAVNICILYSVLWSGFLEKSEIVRRSLHSVAFAICVVVVFLAYRAGYLHHPIMNN